MNSFSIVIFLLALLAPVLAIILFLSKVKEHKAAIDNLTANNIALSSQLSENQEKLAQTARDLSELEGRAAPLWQYEELHSAVMEAENKIKMQTQ
ncbi:hypothetical protein LNO88_08510 [Klebsiella pneumoniae subsp. pneumoniae]|nr:hypothetical protein [Klebsiella pneumoniae subsp. pneumoniae]